MVAVGVVAVDFEHHAGDALGAGVVVSAFGVVVGRECLLGDVVSEFCDTDKSALSHRRFSSAGVIPHCHPSLQQSNSGWLASGLPLLYLFLAAIFYNRIVLFFKSRG